jgi:hypothetical protein
MEDFATNYLAKYLNYYSTKPPAWQVASVCTQGYRI